MNLCFQYTSVTPSYDTQQVYFSRLHKTINWEDMLLESLYCNLNFPPYYGFNWDAFNECINDLSWIDEKKVVLFHEQLPNINSKLLKVYLEILNDAVIHWNIDTEHDFEVIFMETDRSRILEVMKR